MTQIHLPISITYNTKGVTPLKDVISALQAADKLIEDSIELLPSFIDGLEIQKSSVNVTTLTQESPLRELFLVSLIVAFQNNLEQEVPSMLETIFEIDIPDSYDTILTVVVMMVVFYGISFAKDASLRAISSGKERQQLDQLIKIISARTEKTEEEVKKILDARYSKPATVKSLVRHAQNLFLPSQIDSNAEITFDRQRIESDVVAEVPFSSETNQDQHFNRYAAHSNVVLELHAQDRDKGSTGWAAVAKGITSKRLRMKVIEPLSPNLLWGKDAVRGDITIVSKLTAKGFEPAEIHLTSFSDIDEN